MVKAFKQEGCEQVYLNVTGGYKGTVPYSTLMGMLYPEAVETAYLFEDSPEIIAIPTYPVGLDFQQWHANALRLRMARELVGRRYFIPDRPVGNLIQKGGMSAFGEELENQYIERLDTDPLKIYSKAIVTRLLHREGPWAGGQRPEGAACPDSSFRWEQETVEKLQKILHSLIDRVGDIIWLGDKLPEMVEHAQRHHHDLLEFTELFLTPILYYKPDFLKAEDRFVLLSAVLLHDSGHSLDCLSVNSCRALEGLFGSVAESGLPQEIPLLPNDVRDYHQYLAGIRLNDPQMGAELGWPGREGFKKESLPEDLHDAVILACLYHRRRMDYDQAVNGNREKGMLHLTGQWPGPLLCQAERFKSVDLMKIVALLRLIDGCDSQARRAGPRAQVDLSMALLQRDYRTAAMRAEHAYKSFQNWNVAPENGGKKSEWLQALRPEECEVDIVVQPWRVDDGQRKHRIECLKLLEDPCVTEDDRQGARLWLMAAEAADRASMRFGQWPHFMKHRAVSVVRVLPDACFGPKTFSFHIVLVPDEMGCEFQNPFNPSEARSVQAWLDNSKRADIENEVSSEYKQVFEYAYCQYDLLATYWWESDWENRDRGGRAFFNPSTG
jgi:hypothetical protein